MKIIQIIAWRDGLVALDDVGQLWFAMMESGLLVLCWQRLNTPDSREMGDIR